MQDAEENGTRILEKLGLLPKKDVSCKNPTIADLKRLEVARALATHPELFLLDEVITGLNPTEIQEFIELIRQIRDEGVTIFIVEHMMKAMMSLSDRIIVLHHGEKITEGTHTQGQPYENEHGRPLSMPSGGQPVNIRKRNFTGSARESDLPMLPFGSRGQHNFFFVRF